MSNNNSGKLISVYHQRSQWGRCMSSSETECASAVVGTWFTCGENRGAEMVGEVCPWRREGGCHPHTPPQMRGLER